MLRARKLLAGLLVASGIIMIALVLWLHAAGTASSRIPNPNGYDDFVRAGVLMQGDNFSDYPTLEVPVLADLVKSNSAALAIARHGLTLPCYLSTEGILKTNGFPTRDLVVVKRLAQLFAAEGRLAESENRYADAAQSYLDAARLGNESSRGGFLINRLVGVACEGIGMSRLSNLIPTLDCSQSRRVISDLQKLDDAGIEWSAVVKSERRFMWNQIKQYRNPIRLVEDVWQTRSSEKKAKQKHEGIVAQRRLILLELVLRCYKAEQGHPPGTLNQLSPTYLRSLPLDPFTERPFIYRAEGTNWLLYGTGPDKVDNGGTSSDQFYNSKLPVIYNLILPVIHASS